MARPRRLLGAGSYRWWSEQDARTVELFEMVGLPERQVADFFGTRPEIVEREYRKFRKMEREYRSGWPMKPVRTKWTDAEIDVIRKFAALGATRREIARILGRGEMRVADQCRRRGIETKVGAKGGMPSMEAWIIVYLHMKIRGIKVADLPHDDYGYPRNTLYAKLAEAARILGEETQQ